MLLPGLTQSEGSVASPSAAVTGLQLADARDGESTKRSVDGDNASGGSDMRGRRSRGRAMQHATRGVSTSDDSRSARPF